MPIRAILKLGRTCEADDRGLTLNKARDNGVDLSQVDRSDASQTGRAYLNNGRLKYLFLYHAYSPSSPVHVFALFLPNGSVKLHVVDPATRRQPIPRFDTLYGELLQKKEKEPGREIIFPYPDELQSSTDYHGSEAAALKAVSRELGTLGEQVICSLAVLREGLCLLRGDGTKASQVPCSPIARREGGSRTRYVSLAGE